MLKYVLLAGVCLGIAGYFAPKLLQPKVAHAWQVESAVPAAVTLIEPDRDSRRGGGGDPNPSLGDIEGRKLYILDADKASGKSPACTGACTQTWTPFAAPADAKSFGAWSVAAREDGSHQWAYQGNSLYLRASPGPDALHASDIVGHVALFKPEGGIALPLGIGVQNVMDDGGYGLVDRDGMTLYAFAGDARDDQQACFGKSCTNRWKPLFAPEFAHGVGDFSLVSRKDGRRQWAYRNEPLYTFDGDLVPGSATGKAVDKKWHVALLLNYFMPSNVHVETRSHGETLTTGDGKTLYTRHPFVFQAGGFDIYKGLFRPYSKGKNLGTKGCDAVCLKTWHPFTAPADAAPSGFWEVARRDDGTRQWMYKGYALYTYTGDVNPGDVNGNDIFDLIENDDGPYTVAIAGVGNDNGGSALYWHIASP